MRSFLSLILRRPLLRALRVRDDFLRGSYFAVSARIMAESS